MQALQCMGVWRQDRTWGAIQITLVPAPGLAQGLGLMVVHPATILALKLVTLVAAIREDSWMLHLMVVYWSLLAGHKATWIPEAATTFMITRQNRSIHRRHNTSSNPSRMVPVEGLQIHTDLAEGPPNPTILVEGLPSRMVPAEGLLNPMVLQEVRIPCNFIEGYPSAIPYEDLSEKLMFTSWVLSLALHGFHMTPSNRYMALG